MTKKQLGASQVYVSPMILGTWSMGGDYFGETEDRAGETVIRTYLENGIDTFDTAEIYGNGRAETVLGRALEGVMRGAGDTVPPMWLSLISTVFLRIPLAYALAWLTRGPEYPNGRPEALFGSMLITWTIGAGLHAIAYRSKVWKRKLTEKQVTQETMA